MNKPSPSRIRNLFVLFGLSLIALLLFQVEWEEKSRDLGFTREATQNRHLALQRFLEMRGHTTHVDLKVAEISQLPPTEGILILGGTRQFMPEADVARLYDWVKRGGLLLVEARESNEHGEGPGKDRLLDKIGIWAEESPPVEKKVDEDVAEADEKASAKEQKKTSCNAPNDGKCNGVEIHLPLQSLPLCVGIQRWYRLVWRDTDGNVFTAGDTDDVQYAARSIGKGRAIVVTDLAFLDNRHIDEKDNVYLIDLLARSRTDVWVLIRPVVPSLISVLIEAFPWSSAALALSLVLGIWHVIPRLGPVWLGTPSTWRNQYSDHLRNSGGFLWRHGAGGAVIIRLQQRALLRVAEIRRSLGLPPEADMAPHLARLTRLPVERIHTALYTQPPERNSTAFILHIQTLQILRNAL